MATAPAAATPVEYPARFDVDYPEGPRNRLTVAFRFLLIIPIVFVLLTGGGSSGGAATPAIPGRGSLVARIEAGHNDSLIVDSQARTAPASRFGGGGVLPMAGGVVIAPTVLMLLFRRKYPRWWFDWNREVYRFGNRVRASALLLRDEYPSTDEEQAVHTEIDYPDAQQLNRWLPLVKWFLAIAHYIVLAFLGVVVVTVVAWFAILITGRYPRGLFDFFVGVARWALRVSAYSILMVTDRYPPFSTQ